MSEVTDPRPLRCPSCDRACDVADLPTMESLRALRQHVALAQGARMVAERRTREHLAGRGRRSERDEMLSALRSTEAFLADMEASDNPACDPDSTAWLSFAPLLSQVRAILREAGRRRKENKA